MNPKLQEAVAIFKSLGWEQLTPEKVLLLSLGTKEQKQKALAGLKSGEWGTIAEIRPNTYGWRSDVDVDEGHLALFAVRAGVDARRATNILGRSNREMLIDVVAERGVRYATDFIIYACVSHRRAFEHSASLFGSAAVRLVDRLDLTIPQSAEYIKDWAVYAAAAMGLPAETHHGETDMPDAALIAKRFAEHIETGVAVNAPATGPFGAVLPAGVQRGWLSRERAVELVFSALDAAVRPGDRKVWLDVLDALGISDEALCARTQALIPLLASGDTALVTRLGPVLIAQAGEGLLIELLIASLSATTKKARRAVLKAALARPCPKDANTLSPWLSLLAGGTDKPIASLATQLMDQWQIDAEVLPEEFTPAQGLWQATPPLWPLPAFELGEATPEALTGLAAEMVGRLALVHDTLTERFLAVANAVAHESPEAARASLRGLRAGRWQLIDFLLSWIRKEVQCYGFDDEDTIYPLLAARDYVVCQQLDALPCLLSTPSADDLSISVPDLAARLESYQKVGKHALEADLFLALTRLDSNTKTPTAVKRLQVLKVSVVLQSGKPMPLSAGQIVLNYLNDPIMEPPFLISKYDRWAREPIVMPDALRDFPNRFDWYADERFSIFPLWGDVALGAVRWDGEVYPEKGLILRQVARRATPLPPGGAINLLAAQRSHTPHAAEDATLAVTEAWARGLLRPGVADVSMLDWSPAEPSSLAALAAALDGIARDGMLSVVWPVLDGLIEASLKAPRMVPGTAEIAELVAAFLPAVQAAVDEGAAEPAALHLPGIRALARRGGASRAASAAQKAAALLPSEPARPAQEKSSEPVMEPPFEQVWPVQKTATPPIEDGVSITVDWANPEAPTRLFCFTLTLPGVADRVFQVVKQGWYYDMECEGQCQAYTAAPGTPTFSGNRETQVWLHWDAKQKTMAVRDKRNWVGGNDGPLKGVESSPLSVSLLTVVIGLLAQDGSAVYYGPSLLNHFIESRDIGEEMIRRATQTLLQYPVVSPAKLVRALEKDVLLLPVLWPMLTECIQHAGRIVAAGEALPVWVNRVLDTSLRYAPYLAEAAKRGLIPAVDAEWPGLFAIADAKSKSAAVAKAKKLLAMVR